jgi:LAO/AO transport system kinase
MRRCDTLGGLPPESERWVERIRAGEVRALARALTWVESRAPGSDELLARLFDERGDTLRIGVTGAPGSGKSTLVDAMIGELRRAGKRVAALAVDPTSPFTGGAILADRVRMLEHASDDRVYIRSMASRGSLGGLAPAAADVLTVLEAARFDVILIETVGVGQAEVDVAGLADPVALVLTPGAGDDMQAMKAGIMEIADVYVLNKADLPGADTLERHLAAMLSLRGAGEGEAPAILRTVATDHTGVPELLAILRGRVRSPARAAAYWRVRLEQALMRGLAEARLPRLATGAELDAAAAAVAAGARNPYDWVRHLLRTAGER